jgi:hypothetical protein
MMVEIILGFVLTFVIEFIVIWLFLRKQSKFWGIVLFTFLINLFTWPLAQLFYGERFNFYIIELFVIIIESILIMLLFKLRYWKSFSISIVANIISALLGKIF